MLCLLFNTICAAPEHHWPVLLCGVNIAEKIEILNLQHIGKVMVNQAFLCLFYPLSHFVAMHIYIFLNKRKKLSFWGIHYLSIPEICFTHLDTTCTKLCF